jgi:hypothetical protein
VKFRLERRSGDDVRAIWLVAFLAAGFGWYFIEARFEHAIRDTQARTESMYRRMVVNERIVQQSQMLSRVQATALSDLRRVSHETSLSATTAQLILALDSSAKRNGTPVTAVEPEAVQPRAVARQQDSSLSATGLTIKAHGKFRGLLRFIEDLTHHATLLSVSDTQLEVANGEQERAEPKLDATIHATLYRLHIPPQLEKPVATDK